MNLFCLGEFTLNSGRHSSFKIDCDALTESDWEALAALAVKLLPPFGEVIGIPKGGLPFARALEKYITKDSSIKLPWLVVDDVLTTGHSMERERLSIFNSWPDVIGVVVFARGECPDWVTPLFTMTPTVQNN